MTTGIDRASAAALLAWWISVGADEAVDDIPWDRFAPPDRKPAPRPDQHAAVVSARSLSVSTPSLIPPPEMQAGPLGTPEAAHAARDMAAAANSLEELRAAIGRFDGLALKASATNLVFADGNPSARLMLVGEAPGAEEDRRGLPFVGPAGQLLDRMLAAIGRDRSTAYITNIVNWRPPGNRNPTPAEMALSQPFIERHIALIDPAVVVLLGGIAAKTLTGRSEGITRLRGRWFPLKRDDGAETIPALATFHPAFLLRSPGQKREAWIDLLTVKRKLDELGA
jgi:DNA polymerase